MTTEMQCRRRGGKSGNKTEGRRRAEEGNERLMVKATLFYADDGLVASIYLGWLQSEFDTLKGVFDLVGI